MSEISKDLHTEHMVINMGPSHPVTHGTVKFLATLDGETIVDLDVEIGYLHRGFEKMCENSTWQQVIPYTDRLNYVSPLINNTGYALAVEKLLGIDVPERCKYLRVIACELSRLSDHLTNVAAAGLELGAFTAFLYFVGSSGTRLGSHRIPVRGSRDRQLCADRRAEERPARAV